MPRVSNPAIKCAEGIAIASLFHNIPVPPSSNVMHRISEGQHVLSLDQERKLSGTLAFLAHNQEGAEHIPAVCIGEDSAAGFLNVIFAVNKAKYSDGNDVLHSIQQGFDEIFALLARVPTEHSQSLKNQVFYMVVSMCSSRILSRLRLGPTGCRKMKRSFKDTLQELTMALTHISRDKLKDRSLLEAVDMLLTRTKEVRKVVDLWSRHQVTARLIELVESIYRIQQIEQLQRIIDVIPNNHMEPSARDSFINIVGKVSRYREAARFLYRTAKNVPLARNMRTVPVHLPEEAFTTPSIDSYTPNLLVKVTEASAKGRQQKLLKEICRVLGLSEQQARDQYCRQKVLRPYPVESTLFTLPASGTTTLTTTTLEGSGITNAGPPAHETASFQPELNQDPDPNESKGSVKRLECTECTNSVSDLPDKSASCITEANPGPESNAIILQGSGISGSVGPKETSEPYSAGPMEIVVEDIAGSSNHSYRIEWLDDKETKKAREGALLIDVEEIEEEITLCEHNPLYMTARGAILRLSWTSEKAR
ncbi:hypothetical protein CNMCM6936_006251 [Aspergillus lentulus]|nr:hypothetical protein CNMCM6936_006251 [Aspergillus lentulus]